MFIQTIQQLGRGEASVELDEALRQLVDACIEHQKKGEFILKVKLTPKGDQVIVSESFSVKTPTRERMDTIMFVQPDGTLGRRDPRQPELPFTKVPRSGEGDAKQAAK